MVDKCYPNPCAHTGICSETSDGSSFTCSCPAYWTGPTCVQDYCSYPSPPCKNGATCLVLEDTFKCACKKGYTGPTCSDIDYCPDPFVCENGGTCVSLPNKQTFKCDCKADYLGRFCSTKDYCYVDPEPATPTPMCGDFGTCSNFRDSYTCVCADGYEMGPDLITGLNTCVEVPGVTDVIKNFFPWWVWIVIAGATIVCCGVSFVGVRSRLETKKKREKMRFENLETSETFSAIHARASMLYDVKRDSALRPTSVPRGSSPVRGEQQVRAPPLKQPSGGLGLSASNKPRAASPTRASNLTNSPQQRSSTSPKRTGGLVYDANGMLTRVPVQEPAKPRASSPPKTPLKENPKGLLYVYKEAEDPKIKFGQHTESYDERRSSEDGGTTVQQLVDMRRGFKQNEEATL